MTEQNHNLQRLPTSSKHYDGDNSSHLYDTTLTGSRNQSEVCSSETTRNCQSKYNAGSTYEEQRPPRLPPRPPRDALTDETGKISNNEDQFFFCEKKIIFYYSFILISSHKTLKVHN
jgi:hypothetical protein